MERYITISIAGRRKFLTGFVGAVASLGLKSCYGISIKPEFEFNDNAYHIRENLKKVKDYVYTHLHETQEFTQNSLKSRAAKLESISFSKTHVLSKRLKDMITEDYKNFEFVIVQGVPITVTEASVLTYFVE